MKLEQTFNTGVLPLNSNTKIAVNIPPQKVSFYDYELKDILNISGYQIIGLSDNNALLRINRDVIFYSITKQNQTIELKNTRIFPFIIDESVLFNYRKSRSLELRNFSTAEIIWKTELDVKNRVIQGVCNSSFFVGNILESLNKICINIESGEMIWQKNINSFLKVDEEFAGNNYLISDLLVSLASKKDYFGVDVNTGEILWHLDLVLQLKMGHVVVGSDMFIIVRESKEVYLLKIDLLNGEITDKELLTEEIQRLQIYPRGNTGLFGQISYYNNHLFFGANNKLIRLNLTSYRMENLYDHTAEFYFSKVIGSKLFYSDNNFTTLVFELNDADKDS